MGDQGPLAGGGQVVVQPRLLALPEDRPGGPTGRPASAAKPALPLGEAARQAGLAGVERARQALREATERAETARAAARPSRAA